MFVVAAVSIAAETDRAPDEAARALDATYNLVAALRQAEEASDYQVEALLDAARA
jgi:hypothetical protein